MIQVGGGNLNFAKLASFPYAMGMPLMANQTFAYHYYPSLCRIQLMSHWLGFKLDRV